MLSRAMSYVEYLCSTARGLTASYKHAATLLFLGLVGGGGGGGGGGGVVAGVVVVVVVVVIAVVAAANNPAFFSNPHALLALARFPLHF